MIHKHKYKDVEWVDVENPTQEEARMLLEQYGVDPTIADELLSPSVRPHVDHYKDFIYMVMHFPAAHSHKEMVPAKKIHEVDFIISKKTIITTRYEEIDALQEFSKVFEVNSILEKTDMDRHAGLIFFYIIKQLYKSMNNKVENVRDLLVDVEGQIFKGKEKQMVAELSKLNRVLLTFKESVGTHKEVLQEFETIAEKFFDLDISHHIKSMYGEFRKVSNTIDITKDYLNELKATNDSLLSTKQNEIMKVLTIMAFVTFPLSLVASIFGMNTISTPIIGGQNDFWIILGIMFIMTGMMFAYFKSKDWL